MISHLRGTVLHISERYLVLEVGNLGYKVAVTNETLRQSRLGNVFSLWTHLAVREDALDLYGFLDKKDLEFFELLIGVSGIGPKSALGILNAASAETLRKAVTSGDTSYLTKVSGIGKKTAEKIIRELKEKIGSSGEKETRTAREEVDSVEALKSLGYSQQEAREALQQIDKTVTGTSARVKAALKLLGRQ